MKKCHFSDKAVVVGPEGILNNEGQNISGVHGRVKKDLLEDDPPTCSDALERTDQSSRMPNPPPNSCEN
ncbi:hypothetical protein GWI33_000872 [Rhynchophorus ferrugineus]|uniref:Uncharacterized protein n=1 Tax=Rhynchophorus ferrugineus TaxID=354439 RepID=A0A834ILV6_RHYFE|nr:hypothetical protein GWI33_000872 [Rhynchophorus ferrugineus]